MLMNRNIRRISLLASLILLAMATGGQKARGASSIEALKKRYTKERPLVIINDWEFAPFNFRNDNGSPDGFNIDILRTILNRTNIPHVFVMKEWFVAVQLFEKGEADLTISTLRTHSSGKYYYSRNIIAPYKVAIAYRKGSHPPRQLKRLRKEDTAALKPYDYAERYIKLKEAEPDRYKMYQLPKQALYEIQKGSIDYFIWGMEPLKWVVREYQLTGIELAEIDIPYGDLRFTSRDGQLIEMLDDQYSRMQQSGEARKIKVKWFFPEQHKESYAPLITLTILALFLLTGLGLAIKHHIQKRLRAATQKAHDINLRMQYALDSSDIYVGRMEKKTGKLTNLYRQIIPDDNLTYQTFVRRIHPDDRENFITKSSKLINGEAEQVNIEYRLNTGSEEHPEWRNIFDQAMVERGEDRQATAIICTFTDITKELLQRQEIKSLSEKYHHIFEKSIIAIAFYGSDGEFLDANAQMRQLCQLEENSGNPLAAINIFDLPLFKALIDRHRFHDDIRFCTKGVLPGMKTAKYMELHLRPLEDEAGNLIFVAFSARDITIERQIYIRRKQEENRLKQASNDLMKSEKELEYLFENSKMRLWHSSFDERKAYFYKGSDHPDLVVDFDTYYEHVVDDKEKLEQLDQNLAANYAESYTAVRKIKNLFNNDGKVNSYAISSIPRYDREGNQVGCYGLIRNITDLVEAQEKLKQETERANDSSRQKSAFLANMSHEIRTPLNAIVGFSDLLQAVKDPEEKKEFIRIIRNNCDMLLRLINDILATSSIDSSELVIMPKEVDFALAFNEICASLQQRVTNPAVSFKNKNPYLSLTVSIDIDRITQVITNFVTNAVKYTPAGHILVGYEQRDNGLYIYCEDTGTGIPEEKYTKIFERFVKLNDFVQGTGLGLSICKAIAEKSGGKIGVESEEGKGSTFWIWIPASPTAAIEA